MGELIKEVVDMKKDRFKDLSVILTILSCDMNRVALYVAEIAFIMMFANGVISSSVVGDISVFVLLIGMCIRLVSALVDLIACCFDTAYEKIKL